MTWADIDPDSKQLQKIIKRLLRKKTYADASLPEMKSMVTDALALYQSRRSIKNAKDKTLLLIARQNHRVLEQLNDLLKKAIDRGDKPRPFDQQMSLPELFVNYGVRSEPGDLQKMEEIQEQIVLQHTDEQLAIQSQLRSALEDGVVGSAEELRKKYFKKRKVTSQGPGHWFLGDAWPENYARLKVMSWNVKDQSPSTLKKNLDDKHDLVLLQNLTPTMIDVMPSTYKVIYRPVQFIDGVPLQSMTTRHHAILYNWKLQLREEVEIQGAIIATFKYMNAPLSVASISLRKKADFSRIRENSKIRRRTIMGGHFKSDLGGSPTACSGSAVDQIIVSKATLSMDAYTVTPLPCPAKKRRHFPIMATIRYKHDDDDDIILMPLFEDIILMPPPSKNDEEDDDDGDLNRIDFLIGDEDTLHVDNKRVLADARRETEQILREALAKRRNRIAGMLAGGCSIM